MGSSFSLSGRVKQKHDVFPATTSPERHPIRPDDPFRPLAASEPSRSTSRSHRAAWKHDVFLSFRGEDTRRSITSHLFRLLKERGVDVFIDDSLERGGDISSQLIDTIRSSRISVVIFSKNYADSGWCLQELVEIMECKNKSQGQVVIPVFYDVDPSDVRNQRGEFGKALAAKHKHNKNVARWRAALTEAGKLSGWDMTNSANGSEAEIVKKIAKKICDQLNNTYLDVGKYMVGLEQRMMRVNQHVNGGSSDDVRFVVISGMGGLGKTTLAKAVYNQLVHTFEANCFLANIGENSKTTDGLIHLQEQLLRDVLRYENHLGSVDRGCNVIKERMSSGRVLVILDDLTHRDQMKALAREREWFGPGSRIIITTRNLDSVKEIKPDFVYKLEGLDDDDSLQLFSMHAFGSTRPKEGFTELSRRVVSYCTGLPLALEVLGASLLDQSPKEWESELRKLSRTPHDEIQKILEISHDALGRNEKELFLHIACFFAGRTKVLASLILEACDFDVETGLGILIKRNLVRIEYPPDGLIHVLQMHDLIRDMGNEIVRRESKHPEERSRLFSDGDILTTLGSGLGSEKVEGLVMQTASFADIKRLRIDAKSFAGMKRLRMLQLNSIHVIGDYGHFSEDLRWLCWTGFPLQSLPDEFYMGNLVIMEMPWSSLQSLWGTSMVLEHLRFLHLSHSHFLIRTPDFSKLPSLEEVFMSDCIQLKEVNDSIDHLKRLHTLILEGCKELESIPDSICRVKSLKILDIRDCSKIKRLPDDLGELSSLENFRTDGAPIEKLPPSIANLKNLLHLNLRGSSLDFSFVKFGSLVFLRLTECNLSDDAILGGIGSLLQLRGLDLSESIFHHLPTSISSLPYLKAVKLVGCPEMESVPVMPPSVLCLNCKDCPKLKEVSGTGQAALFSGCHNLFLECRQSILQNWWGRLLVIPGMDMELEYTSLDTPLSFQFCHRCEVQRIFIQCCPSFPNYRLDPSNPTAYLALSSSTRTVEVELDYFGLGEDNVYIFSFEPQKIMGGREYRGVSVALSVVPNPGVVFKGIKMYFERERCPSCSCEQEHPSAIPEQTVLVEQFQLSAEWSDTPRPDIFSGIQRDMWLTLDPFLRF